MFKNLNRTYIAFCLLLVGTCSSVFAIDLSQAISHANEQSVGIDAIFTGKSSISNLYSKALKIVKDKEVTSTMASFTQLKIHFSACTSIDTPDFINILYLSNPSFRNTFNLILPIGTKLPTASDIDKSYDKFFTCRGIFKPTTTDRDSLNNEINVFYLDIYTNTYTMANLNKNNFGSDLFFNGTLDDSDFDLLYDINQIGKIFFETFNDTPQLLFYRLPIGKQYPSQNDSLLPSSQSSYQVGSTGTSGIPGTAGSPGTTPPPSGGGSSPNLPGTSSSSLALPSSSLAEVQNFVNTTNNVLSPTPGGVALVLGNQCLSGDTPVVEEQVDLMSPEEYISGISDFVKNANVDAVINDSLLSEFTANNPLPSGGNTSDTGYADSVANYTEQILSDAIPGTCEYTCKDLPIDKQTQCEFACAGSCVQKCTDSKKGAQSACNVSYDTDKVACGSLSLIKKPACLIYAATQKKLCDQQVITDQLLCISDCTCFLISGPNGKGWEKMEDMYRIKFCKVPVQKQPLRPGKTVFSIQAIFQEVSDVLQGLKDGGQMVKFSKTKEFLDGNIKIKFADNFSFKLQVGFKPVFEHTTTATKIKEQLQANTDLNIAVLGMNTSAPEADDYNKYIIVSDTVANNANMEPATSLAELNANIDKFAAATSKSKEGVLSTDAINSTIITYAQNTNVLFVKNMIEFLKDNQLFLQNLGDTLSDMNNMSFELSTKVQNAQ